MPCRPRKARKTDYVIVDTAGRLQTKTNLMAELEKMRRTAARVIPDAPHEVLLVLDATTGQNGLEQARKFTETSGVTGIVLTKLDGTAKGGIVVAIARELNLPIRYVGVGEKVDDLLPFDPEKFIAFALRKMTHDREYMREAARRWPARGRGAGQPQSDGGRGDGARWRSRGPRLSHLGRREACRDSGAGRSRRTRPRRHLYITWNPARITGRTGPAPMR